MRAAVLAAWLGLAGVAAADDFCVVALGSTNCGYTSAAQCRQVAAQMDGACVVNQQRDATPAPAGLDIWVQPETPATRGFWSSPETSLAVGAGMASARTRRQIGRHIQNGDCNAAVAAAISGGLMDSLATIESACERFQARRAAPAQGSATQTQITTVDLALAQFQLCERIMDEDEKQMSALPADSRLAFASRAIERYDLCRRLVRNENSPRP